MPRRKKDWREAGNISVFHALPKITRFPCGTQRQLFRFYFLLTALSSSFLKPHLHDSSLSVSASPRFYAWPSSLPGYPINSLDFQISNCVSLNYMSLCWTTPTFKPNSLSAPQPKFAFLPIHVYYLTDWPKAQALPKFSSTPVIFYSFLCPRLCSRQKTGPHDFHPLVPCLWMLCGRSDSINVCKVTKNLTIKHKQIGLGDPDGSTVITSVLKSRVLWLLCDVAKGGAGEV